MAAVKRVNPQDLPAAGKRGGVPPLLKARWLATESVERVSADELSLDDFRRRFASGSGTPVIVTDCASKWPALAEWRAERLAERFPEMLWRVSAACDMTFPAFLDYCAALRPGSDPRPLYLFDRSWREKCPELRDELTVPAYFAEDLMGVLGEARRPSYSWITAGPPLSGSSFHVDPNANSAWNATVQGAKKWVLYPNSLPPAMDGDGLTQLSLVEWFADHYDDCPHAAHRLECITRPGEIMFIPAGWWHLVLNLELSVAVTHNVVTRDNLLAAADFMAVDQTCARGEGCRGTTAFDANGDVPASVINPRADAVAAVAPPSEDAAPAAAAADEARSAPVRAEADEPPTCACNAKRRQLWLDFQTALDQRSPGLLAQLRAEAEARKRPSSLWEGRGLAPGQSDTSFAFNFG